MSAFFSASEIAFASLNKYHLTQEKGAKKSLASFLALKIYNDYDKVLGTILVGNTLVNIFASSVATVLVIKYLNYEKKSNFFYGIYLYYNVVQPFIYKDFGYFCLW